VPTTLEEATQAFYDALNGVLGGNVAPMLTLWSHADDITYMSPFGELLVGWEPIRDSWQTQADQRLGGRVEPEQVRHFASPTLGFVVGFERGTIEIDGTPTRVDIRATSLYRVEDGRWTMIGHHTDPLGQ
jgi:ketosteroid isomerase-like protein